MECRKSGSVESGNGKQGWECRIRESKIRE